MTVGHRKSRPLFDAPIVRRAIVHSFSKLDPRHQIKNPVMFVVEIGSVLTTVLFVQALVRESGGDRSAVTGGTRVLSDWLVIRITSEAGETFLDRMIAMVEGAKRQKTPNEIALNILLAGFTIIFLLATVTLLPFSIYAVHEVGQGTPITVTVLAALLVCLIPTTIGGLLSAIGIAGMDRMVQANVIAMSGRAVEAAGDVDVLLLDHTGTITLGNRQATNFIPATGVDEKTLADAAQIASRADETPE